jgi:predicted dehydrogenase
LDDASKLVNTAREKGLPLMPGHVVRFFPEFRKGHDLVEQGAVGNPAAARLRRGGGMPKGENLWFADHAQSGGVLLDLAIHDFDWLRWTLGDVKRVFANSVGARTGSGPDYALTTLQFDSGAVAHVEATWMDPSGFRVAYEVCGSAGMIEYDSRLTPTVRTAIEGSATATESPLGGSDDPYYRQLSAFVESIQDGKEPPITGFDGLMALAISEAAMESSKTGRAVAPARLM